MPTTSIVDKDLYYDFIDGLRGIAVLLVVAIHTSEGMGYYYDPSFGSDYAKALWMCGARGVDLFFILSAFTLFNSSHKRFTKDPLPVLSFYVRRAFRILPLWWAAVLLFGLMAHKTVAEMMPSALFYFGFLRYDPSVEIVGGGWSLFVEETFYLFLPLIFGMMTSLKSSLKVLLALFVVMKLWTRYAAKCGVPDTNTFIFMFPFTYWFCFASGISIYYLLKHRTFLVTMESSVKMRFLDAAALVTMSTLLLKPLTLSTVALILFVVASYFPRTICGKITRSPLLIKYGTCCYSIYLFHALVFRLTHDYITGIINLCGLGGAPLTVKSTIAFLLMAAACLPFGLASFHFFEKPVVNLGKTVIRRIHTLNARGTAYEPT